MSATPESVRTSAASPAQKEIPASFLQFLSGMAAQTLMHLGMLENPITRSTVIDLPNAKYSIDLLGILQQKTAGNLTPEEAKYLEAAICDLQMRYAAAAGKK